MSNESITKEQQTVEGPLSYANNVVDDPESTDRGGLSDMESMTDYPDLDDAPRLQKAQHFIDLMQKVEDELAKCLTSARDISYSVDDDEEGYRLIYSAYEILYDIGSEIDLIYRFIRDHYKFKFPELYLYVPHQVDYARVVKKIGNETDLSLVDLRDILPRVDIIIVNHVASTTSGKPLPEKYLKKTLDACDRAIALDLAMTKIFELAKFKMGEERFERISRPSYLLQSTTVGGLPALAKRLPLPLDNQHLPAKRKSKEETETSKPPTSFGEYFKQTKTFKRICPLVRKRVGKFLDGF